jgi:ribosomal-protein-alanine N-acetyltransferase
MIGLRDAVFADLDMLYELDTICFAADIAYSRREFRGLLRSRATIGVVAEEGRELAGFCIAQRVPDSESGVNPRVGHLVGHIVTIDVAPAYRRRGVGRLLMGEVESRMRIAGAAILRLEAAEDNLPALRFYAGLGFEPMGAIPDYYRSGRGAVVMEKPLALMR